MIVLKYILFLSYYYLSFIMKHRRDMTTVYKRYKEAYSYYKSLPKNITIYRGCRTDELEINNGRYGVCWSLKPDVAFSYAEWSPCGQGELWYRGLENKYKYHVVKAVIPKKRLYSIARICTATAEVRVRLSAGDKVEEFCKDVEQRIIKPRKLFF